MCRKREKSSICVFSVNLDYSLKCVYFQLKTYKKIKMILQNSNTDTDIKCHHGIMTEIPAIMALYTFMFLGPSHASFHSTIKENWL